MGTASILGLVACLASAGCSLVAVPVPSPVPSGAPTECTDHHGWTIVDATLALAALAGTVALINVDRVGFGIGGTRPRRRRGAVLAARACRRQLRGVFGCRLSTCGRMPTRAGTGTPRLVLYALSRLCRVLLLSRGTGMCRALSLDPQLRRRRRRLRQIESQLRGRGDATVALERFRRRSPPMNEISSSGTKPYASARCCTPGPPTQDLAAPPTIFGAM